LELSFNTSPARDKDPSEGGGKKMFNKKPKVYVGKISEVDITDNWSSSVIGLLVGILIMILVTVLTGCSETRQDQYVRYDEPMDYCEQPAVSPKLLLRAPGEESMDPQGFAYRSDWPSATGDTDLGQVTTYQEYSYNRQSLAPCVQDYSSNTFQTYRTGISVK
jgi:hypothetical protein